MDISGINSGGQVSSDIYNNVDIKPIEAKIDGQAVKSDKKKDLNTRINENVESLNKALINQNAKYIIRRHEVFGDTMIKIIDKSNNHVLLEIPPEKFLDMIAKLCEIVGLKVDKKA